MCRKRGDHTREVGGPLHRAVPTTAFATIGRCWAGQLTCGDVLSEGTSNGKMCCGEQASGGEVAVVLVWGSMRWAARGEAAAIVAVGPERLLNGVIPWLRWA